MDLRYLSLGAGVQSSTLYLLAACGEIGPMPDVAIFADTQQEPPWVYEQLDRLAAHGPIPIHRATAGDLGEAIQNGTNTTGGRFASVPFWVVGDDGKETPGRRQCTREYKIDVVKRAARQILGLGKGERAAGRYQVEEWVGISLDEAHRAKPSRYGWVMTRWPLLFDRPMRRSDCFIWLKQHDYPIPQKSACVFCPYRGDAEYLRWKREEPTLFEQAAKWDDLIRSTGTMRGIRGQQFVSRSLKPLRELVESDEPDPQLDLFGNECEGMCGT